MTLLPLAFMGGRIVVDPKVCNGKPTLRDARISVQTILEFLGAGDSEEEILSQYPSIAADELKACLGFAA